ncbi:MAG: PIG-L family deacetylase, partial [Bacteroidales bacterium]|nr:PIG-L family deacetylase [Bacteroidales bacterium]
MKNLFTFLLLILAVSLNAQEPVTGKYKKALVIGAHPDDPESMCGGTMIKLKEQGCEVVCVYFTCGEGGIPGKTAAEAASVRRKEALDACDVMGIRPVFMTQIDGDTQINKERYKEMKDLIDREKPDLVITHWP